MDEKVSVIIPFYYGASWIKGAIDSALNQTYKNIEVIVVNDCSPEDIDKVVSEYNGRIIYFKHEKNLGSGPARNTGISLATGDYISFLDSDDVWLPTKIEKQLNLMRTSNAKWCHTGYYHWLEEQGVLRPHKFIKDYGCVFPHILVTMGILQSSVIISKKVLDNDNNLRFNPSYKYGQDAELYSRIAFNYPVAFVKEPLVKKRETGYEIYTRARLRIRLKANNYKYWKSHPFNGYFILPKALMYIGYIYYLYDRLLPYKETKILNTFSKILWSVPFCLERIYRRYLDIHIKHDRTYLLC